jgi:predicted ArsR family transcriptional regulator
VTGLTERQLDVLDIVSYCYPVTARGVAAHLQISESAARSVLTALERKDLVHRMLPAPSSPRGRYTITKPGNAVLRDQGRAEVR